MPTLQKYEKRLTALEEDLMQDQAQDLDKKLFRIRRELSVFAAYYEQLDDLFAVLSEEAEEGDPNMTEKVTMRLPVNRENPGDNEVVVGLNGRFYKIRRGVTVEVPKAVALILQQSEEQDAATLEMIEAIRDGKQHQG